jgi:hypothetical protein
VDGPQAVNLAVRYSCLSGTPPEPAAHTLNLDLPEAWHSWTDRQQGQWVLWQVLDTIDHANRGARPSWIEFGYELEVSLPC